MQSYQDNWAGVHEVQQERPRELSLFSWAREGQGGFYFCLLLPGGGREQAGAGFSQT